MKWIGLVVGFSCWVGCGASPEPVAEEPTAPSARADVVDRVDVRVGYFNQALEGRDPRHRDLPEPAIQYGQPEWDETTQSAFDALASGERWALGRDFWTTLDVNSGLTVGDAELAPGKYYLALARTDDGFDLVLLDAREVRAAGLAVSRVGETTGGWRAAARHTTLEDSVEKLTFEFPVADTPPGLVDLRARFGPHEWTVDLLADVETTDLELEALGLEAPRKMARLVHDRGIVTIGYGQPEWKQEYVEQFDAATKGKRWRFGRNWWTTLDTNVALRLGDVEVEPGDYYLVGERAADSDEWFLRVLDPADVRELQLDPVMAFETTGGEQVPLSHELTESTNALLEIEFYPDEADASRAVLSAWWGNHRLSTPLRVHVDGADLQ